MSQVAYSLPNAQSFLERDCSLSGGYLAGVLEANPDCVSPGWLRHYLIRHLRGEVKRKPGRKARSAAAVDFALVDARALYEEKLAYNQQQDRIGKHTVPKSERKSAQEPALAILGE